MPKNQKRKNLPTHEGWESNGAPPPKKKTSTTISSIQLSSLLTPPVFLSDLPADIAQHACFFPHRFNGSGSVQYNKRPKPNRHSEDKKERNQEAKHTQNEIITDTEPKTDFFINTRSRAKTQEIDERKNEDTQETDIFSQLASSVDFKQSSLKNKIIKHLRENTLEIIDFFKDHSETQLRRCNIRRLNSYITKLELNRYDDITDILTIYAFQKIYNRPVKHYHNGYSTEPVQMAFSSNAQPVHLLHFVTEEKKSYGSNFFKR
ncbi:MAG: hypothetical protein ACE365_02815 [Gammaproteobacteria bacterium]